MHNNVTQRLKINSLLILSSLLGFAQYSVAADDDSRRLSKSQLVDIVAPVALYPDDLVAVVLPAASYPLQLVQAQRTLDDGGSPDSDWDEAVVAIMNYPEVLEFMNDDLDWTYSLGLAFINQERGVFDAIQDFRAEALAAGNLKSDAYQTVRVDNRGNILIEPQAKDTLYIPRYEPRRVVVRHVTPVYHYYPIARPVYYYPYPASYAFNVGHFYGVGTYFSIGWQYRGLNLFYSNGPRHPFAGRHYAVRYSPRHYYFKPRVRRHVVSNHRHHYRPKHIKRVKHRAKHARSHKRFREAPRQRQVANKFKQRPKHRLARNSIRHEQQLKQNKFRDARREREKFDRNNVRRNDARPAAKRKARSKREVTRRVPVNKAQRNTEQRTVRKAKRRSQPQVQRRAQNHVRGGGKAKPQRQARHQQSQRRVQNHARGGNKAHARQSNSRQANRRQANHRRASRASR